MKIHGNTKLGFTFLIFTFFVFLFNLKVETSIAC